MWVSWEGSGFRKELPKPTGPLGHCLHLRPSSVTARARGCGAGQTVPTSSPGRCSAPRSPDFLPVRPGRWYEDCPALGPLDKALSQSPFQASEHIQGQGSRKPARTQPTAPGGQQQPGPSPSGLRPLSLCGLLTRGPPWDGAGWDLGTRMTGRRVFLSATRIISAE